MTLIPSEITSFKIDVYKEIENEFFDEWSALASKKSVFLCPHYIKAIRSTLSDDIDYRFVTFSHSGKIKGIAAFQIMPIGGKDFNANLEQSKIVKILMGWMNPDGKAMFNVLVMGSVYSTGDHGSSFDEEVPDLMRVKLLNQASNDLMNQLKSEGIKLSAVLMKDCYPKYFEAAKELVKDGYIEFQVDPTMVMPLLDEWKTFEDYLAAMGSKLRTKAKSVHKKSADLVVKELSAEELKHEKDRFNFLYDSVYEHAGFRMGKLNHAAFLALKEAIPDQVFIKGLFLGDQMVGFLSGFYFEDHVDAHFVGIDYEKNQSMGIYNRMLYEYIKVAFDRGVKKVVLGRTALQIKSSVGAFPVETKLFIRHRSKLPNSIMRQVFKHLKPSDFDARTPYKKDVLEVLQPHIDKLGH